jgi:hypothetical protein
MKGRPRKVSDSGAAEIRAWYAAKRRLPTSRQMRDRFGICSNTLSKIGRGLIHKVRRG